MPSSIIMSLNPLKLMHPGCMVPEGFIVKGYNTKEKFNTLLTNSYVSSKS